MPPQQSVHCRMMIQCSCWQVCHEANNQQTGSYHTAHQCQPATPKQDKSAFSGAIRRAGSVEGANLAVVVKYVSTKISAFRLWWGGRFWGGVSLSWIALDKRWRCAASATQWVQLSTINHCLVTPCQRATTHQLQQCDPHKAHTLELVVANPWRE